MNYMGVIGLDLCCSGTGRMPGKLGRPRYQSKHTSNAKPTMYSDAIAGFKAPAPIGGSALLAGMAIVPAI